MVQTFIISLNSVKVLPRSNRAGRAIKLIKKFVKKHKRVDEKQILISNEVNEEIWKEGIYGIPSKIEIQLFESEGTFTVYLKEGKALEERLKTEKDAKKKIEEEKKQAEKEEKKKPTEAEKEAEEELEKKRKEKKAKEESAKALEFKRKQKSEF